MPYTFLLLSLLLAIPGVVAYALRPDLRSAVHFAIPFSLPFALTEPFFYPEYWAPAFLFDLAATLGFGIEDFLFVVALTALSVVSYPVVARRTLVRSEPAPRELVHRMGRAALLFAGTGCVTAIAALSEMPMIYGCLVAMIAGCSVAWITRPDLRVPSLVGMLTTMMVYGVVCLALDQFHPQVFHTVWRTHALSATFVLGVPIEELLYGAAAGLAGSLFVPFVRGDRLAPLPSRGTRRAATARSR